MYVLYLADLTAEWDDDRGEYFGGLTDDIIDPQSMVGSQLKITRGYPGGRTVMKLPRTRS